MFLKVKKTAGKQYFALCESVRRDKKIMTKTIRSLGNAEKALLILQSDYPEFLERFHDIVGTRDLTIEYWDSQGNRHINFNEPNEQKLYQEWLLKREHENVGTIYKQWVTEQI